MDKQPTEEMKVLINDLKRAYRSAFWYSGSMRNRITERVMGDDGGIPGVRRQLASIEDNIQEYKRCLKACEDQLKIDAAGVFDIPDLPTRIKNILVREGCRTRMDIHLKTLWYFNTPGFGRRSERVLNEWKNKHWAADYEKDKVNREYPVLHEGRRTKPLL